MWKELLEDWAGILDTVVGSEGGESFKSSSSMYVTSTPTILPEVPYFSIDNARVIYTKKF